MDRVLDLSKKIYEAGFVPDMWFGKDRDGDPYCAYQRYVFFEDTFANGSSSTISRKLHQPYFSSDWCWRVLRRLIDVKSFTKDEIVLNYRQNNQGELKQMIFSINESLHETLLRIVLWNIELGYLKAAKG